MKVGKVIGNVTLSHADSGLRGGRYLVVMPQGAKELTGQNPSGLSDAWALVAYDNLGAGVGDDILYVEGAEAMQPFEHRTPLDAISVALLDTYRYEPPQSGG
ncbi:EutN/CcmL family microcompartment protein [Coraliomargarita sp. SDUM461004]|uniref:EutN/CcmL family microcompartment protein n=1 Tax=Thalassobacterium sedimentorum TaxID=3041258 RepID=A0ABU1AK66_9BACT|nr:EutN/CcmL family microcompartment protein [Coraliomargarita sp. SDUM461004]MDQ8194568.1 EutN/CcmL family microcompartment protein [Coraliomargarita sp. SDUM461004]